MTELADEPVGGDLSLEFTNTKSWDPFDPTAGEELGSYQQLLEWSVGRGLISRRNHAALTEQALRRPDEAAQAHQGAMELRAALHDIFSSYSDLDGVPCERSVVVLNEALARLPLRIKLVESGALWDWTVLNDQLGAVTWPILWSAASLLTSPDLAMVKQCAGDRCGWLFVDKSRRHNRKWCDMRDCGNRAKARRHYYRHRANATK